jgi:hypothetical protein
MLTSAKVWCATASFAGDVLRLIYWTKIGDGHMQRKTAFVAHEGLSRWK